MCQTRAYRHSCGHYTTRTLSSCRGTYACPYSSTVLCHAVPLITVSHPASCRRCQYGHFYATWEARIFAAQERRSVANQMMAELRGDMGACGELHDGHEEAVDDTDEMGFDDLCTIRHERQRAESEVEKLHQQFRREQWTKWRPFSEHGSRATTRDPKRPRRPSPRSCGTSPLKGVVLLEELDTADDATGSEDDSQETSSRRTSETSSNDSGTNTPPNSWSPVTSFKLGFDSMVGDWFGESNACATESDSMFPDYSIA